MRNGRLSIVFVFALLSGGCTFHHQALIAQSVVGPKEIPVGMAKGESEAYYFLFFGPFGDNSLTAAVDDALKDTKADTMLNVFVDRETFVIPLLYAETRTKVFGTTVRYEPAIPHFTKPKGESYPGVFPPGKSEPGKNTPAPSKQVPANDGIM